MRLERSNAIIVSANVPRVLKRYYNKRICASSVNAPSLHRGSPSDRYLAKSFIEFSSNCVSLSNYFSLPPEAQYPGHFDILFAYI